VGPALSAARVDLVEVLKRAPTGGTGLPLLSFSHVLVAAQVAVVGVALVIAGLFVRSLYQTNAVTLGWNSRTWQSLGRPREPGYDQTRTLEYYQRAIER